jgi:hypothetical protein
VAELNIKPDLIKLDVEGAEMQVICGAMRTIHEHRPQLAVSIYHSHEDMISIPHFLVTHLKNYVFHVGHYSTGIIETIFYAIPEELKRINTGQGLE